MDEVLVNIEEGKRIKIKNSNNIEEFNILGEYTVTMENCYNIQTLNIVRSRQTPVKFINCQSINVLIYNKAGKLISTMYIGKINRMSIKL